MQRRYPIYQGGRGGRGTMDGGGMALSFPPFTRAIKWLIIINTAIWLVNILLNATVPGTQEFIDRYLSLTPVAVIYHRYAWQLVTYAFLHDPHGISHILFNMLTLWFVGALLEQDWGTKRFLELYFFSLIGAGIVSIGLDYIPTLQTVLHFDPRIGTIGASGGIFGVLIAFAMLYGDMEFWMFPLPFRIKAKYLVAIWIVIALVGAFLGGGKTAYLAHLGGLFFGFAYVKMFPRSGMGFSLSERYYGIRNSYYRWKRRRAAKKFEVYMRKVDRSQYFDEYGNYRDPGPNDDKNKGNGESKWIN